MGWAIVFKWAAILWPVVWRYVKPLLEKSALNADLQWVLPIAESIVGTVERTSRPGTSGTSKSGRAFAMIMRALREQDPERAAKLAERTVRKAIELALEVAPETAKTSSANGSTPLAAYRSVTVTANGIPASGPAEQSGTQVSP